MSGPPVKSAPILVIVLTLLFLGISSAVCADSENSASSERDQKILQVQQLIEDHKLAEARRLTSIAVKQFPRDAGFDNLLGVIAAQEGKYQEAERNFDRAVKREPKFTGAYLNLGRLYQENSGADTQAGQKALQVYAHVLAYDPENAEANYQTALLLLRRNAYRNSLNYLERLPPEIQARSQALAIACADYSGLGDRTRSDATARRLSSAADFSESDIRQMLPALQAGKRDDLAVSLLQNLSTRQALSVDMRRTLGLAYERTDQLAEARATLEQSVSKETLSVSLLLDLARVAYEQRDFQSSLGYLAHAQDLEPKNASLYYYFGFVCVDLNLIAEASNAFEKAVKLDPENPGYNYAMGAAAAFRHDPAEAVPYFQKYLKLRPQDPRGKLALGAALFRAKDYGAAEPWLREAVKTPPTATTAHYYLGCIALQEGRLDEAHSELEAALKGNAKYADAWAELGQYNLMQKNYGEAGNDLRRALEIDPDHYAANFYLLNLYTRTRDPQREAQARRFEDLKKLLDEKTREFLRIVEVRPFEEP